MAPPSLRMLARRAAGTVVAVIVCLPSLGTPVAAVTGQIPAEPGATVLPRSSYTAVTADLDGDGTRELVRLTNWSTDESRLAVEIWRQLPPGTWQATRPEVVIRRGQSVEQALSRQCSQPADADDMLPVLVEDEARLLLWHHGGREHVLAVVNATQGCGDEPPCCLTVWEITAARGTLAPQLTLRADERRGGDIVMALDMDGDGNDELAIDEPAGPTGVPMSSFSVLRWSDGRFRRVTARLNGGEQIQPYLLGNTDGLPGEEVGLVGSFGPDGSAVGLTRISLRDGAINAEPTEHPSGGVLLSLPSNTGTDPALILSGDADHALVADSWPADGTPKTVATAPTPGTPVGIVGSGSNRRILVRRDRPPALGVLTTDLRAASPAELHGSDASKPFLTSTLTPYIGPWRDGASSGSVAQVYAGNFIESTGGSLSTKPMAVLPAVAPIGTMGASAGWVALAHRADIPVTATQLAPTGGRLLRDASFTISLVPVSQVMQPEADGGELNPDLGGTLPDPAAPGTNAIIIGTPVFLATIDSPVGSLAATLTGKSGQAHVLVSADTPVDPAIEILGPPFRIPIVASEGSEGNQVSDVTLHVVTPAGHGYTARWHVRLLRAPPKLAVDTPFLSLGLDATLSGQTDPGVTVSAEGRTTTADARGRYTFGVPADVIPRDVRVEARDALGNRATAVVSVVAPVDYRRLPWIPIVALLTLGAGLVFFVRSPIRDRRALPVSVDDGTFEEIDEETRVPR